MTNKKLLSLPEIRRILKDRRLYVISQSTGLSFPTLKKLADGEKDNFAYNTIKVISDYLKK